MYKTPREAVAFANTVKQHSLPSHVEAVLCAPFLALPALSEGLRETNIGLGAQNVHWEREGAFTGEISIPMLAEIGVTYCIVGHSERRAYFGETDEMVQKKVQALLSAGITPIVCVGETLEQREQGKTKEVVQTQVEMALKQVTPEKVTRIVVAYEPVWAIGTGKAATAQDAEETIAYIRQLLISLFGEEQALQIRIQYGGSVKPENLVEFLSMPNIDGALVGGASLDPQSFVQLVTIAGESK